jgi:hypothetical protein
MILTCPLFPRSRSYDIWQSLDGLLRLAEWEPRAIHVQVLGVPEKTE